eukprot:PITA_13655
MPREDEELAREKVSHMEEGELLVVMRKATVAQLLDQEKKVIMRGLVGHTSKAGEMVKVEELVTNVTGVINGGIDHLGVLSGSTDNLVAIEMVEKLELKRVKHPTPYKVSCLQKGQQLLVDEQCEVEFQIGRYKGKVICDIMLMDVCHILLGRPW